MEVINQAKRVFDMEIEAMQLVRDSLNEDFIRILERITSCKGKVIITGMGKSGHVGRKIAATMASLGTPSFFLHPAEALHGDLGMVSSNDVVIAISYSGESEEITRILPNIKAIGAYVIGISGNPDSTLVRYSDCSQIFPKFQEACYMNLAPTSSTTITLAYGDALAITAARMYGFDELNFGMYHPSGALGKKLFFRVKDIMNGGEENAVVKLGSTLKNAIVVMSTKGLGIVTVVDEKMRLQGVITDGDLRRLLERGVNVYDLFVDEVMTKIPIYVNEDAMAVDALQLLKQKNVAAMPVVMGDKVVGVIRLQAIINSGIIL